MCVSEGRIGKAFHCPDCSAPLGVPEPVIVFACPACAAALSAPEDMENADVLCPACETALHVPECTTVACPACGVRVELDPALYQEMEGAETECPECGAALPIPPRPKRSDGTEAAPGGALPQGFGHKTVQGAARVSRPAHGECAAGPTHAATAASTGSAFCAKAVRPYFLR